MSNETGSNQNESSANDAVAGSRSPFCSLALSEPTPHISAMDVDEIMLEHFGLEHEKRKMEAINAAIDRGDLAIDGEVLTDSLDVVSTYRGGYEAVIDGPFIHFSGSSPRVESAGPKDRTSQNLWVHFSHLQRTLNPYAGSAGRLPPINCLSSTSKSSEPHSGQDSLESLKLLAIVCPFVIEEGSVLRQDGKRYRIATDVEVSVSWSSKAGVQANDQGHRAAASDL